MVVQNSQRNLRIAFAGGGTGGHLIPGAAAADALTQTDPTTRNLFLSTTRVSEQHCRGVLADYEVVEIPAARWDGMFQKFHFSRAALAAAARCMNIYSTFRPDVIVGLGGYSCVVPVLVGRALGRPTMIFESNAIPGRVTRLLAPVANCVQLQWEETAKHLTASNTVVTGNPIRRDILTADRARAQRRFLLAPDRRTLLVMGGSQGARPLNQRLAHALQLLENRAPDLLRKLQILHLTGPDHLEECRSNTWPSDAIYRPLGFSDRMGDVYAVADAVLCRAGGSTIAELTAMGLPSLLVPYPHAKDDHQTANARCMERRGAAQFISQSDLTPARLAEFIKRFVYRRKWLHDIALRAYETGHPRASYKVAKTIRRLAGVETCTSSAPEHNRTTDTRVNSIFKAA
jgi:UDP-N-acetylglucosamine--N-acetylmuramyl-(pentapeptide) pyrophosphoryl-undecaprenol N-acetylglucosamine transferase